MKLRKSNGMQQCDLKDLLYPVKVIDNPIFANSENCKLVMGQLNGKGFFINACSDTYELVENAEIFPRINSILNSHNIKYDVDYFQVDNVRFHVHYKITDPRYLYMIKNTSDKISPMLFVQHSYNGMVKYQIMFGYYRLVCENGLIIAIEEMKQFNLCLTGKHTKSIQDSLKKLNELMVIFADNAKDMTIALTEKYEKLAMNWITQPQLRITYILKSLKIGMIENSKFSTTMDILRRVLGEANNPTLGYNGRVNDWLIYNGINQYLNDNRLNNTPPEKRRETDSKVFEYMLMN
jgi:hypothetical protein